ncbi:MAG: hypothetical protein GXP59_05030 [Deltaproteobacteria bacterium]|nr:hypothetical protein [Deltaproteobacteria bacterium]
MNPDIFLYIMAMCGIGGILALLLPQRHSPKVIAWVGSLTALFLIGGGGRALFTTSAIEKTLWTIPAVGRIVIRVDPLSGLFLVVTGVVFLAVSIFSGSILLRLLNHYNLKVYALMYLSLFAAIVWILISADVFSFLVAWEIMSILCYFLVAYEDENDENPRAAYLMLAMSEAGALAAALGMLLFAAHAGSLEFTALKHAGATGQISAAMRWMIFLLTFFGFGVKAGLVPVNLWLPRAYTAAPAAFAPLLAGATLNLGLYGILRFNGDLLPVLSSGPGLLALIIGTISALLGILYATTENDLKTMLAHSSIENAGIITVGFGAGFVFTASNKPVLAGIAFLVALYHMTNHSLYKTLLLIGSGVVDDRAGTRHLNQLGGLIRQMPVTALLFLTGVLGIAALPPFNGFVSEWLTLQTLLRSAELLSTGQKIVFALCGAGLALTAALAVTCFAKAFAMGFLGMSRSPKAEQATEPKFSALASMAILSVLCLLLGILPTYVIGGLNHAISPVSSTNEAAAALVPPFFNGSPGHEKLPAAFLSDFHDLGAQVGQHIAPGPGLVILHRGGTKNPVVFAASPTYMFIVLAALLAVLFIVVNLVFGWRRTVTRRPCWDGGIRRLLPEMTYTATGFSNPVRVIFQSVFRPTIVEDTRETVGEHFRTAIRRQDEERHILDRLLLTPGRKTAMAVARFFAGMHQGHLNAYVAYVLGALLAGLLMNYLL